MNSAITFLIFVTGNFKGEVHLVVKRKFYVLYCLEVFISNTSIFRLEEGVWI